jgi:hypothetical protein
MMMRSGLVEVPGSGEPVKQERAGQLPWWRRLTRAVLQGWRLAVIWWWATLPAILATWAAGLRVGVVAWVVLVVGSRWLPPWAWRPLDRWPILARWGPTVRVDHRRALAQSFGVGFRMVWPWIAAHAAITVTNNGYWRAPRVIAYDQGPGGPFNPVWRSVTLKPLPLQRRSTWPDLADQVMRTLNQAEVATTVDERHRLTMVFTRDPLPRFVELPPHRGNEQHDFVPLGVGVGGREIGWRPDETPHLTVTGITKGGKGITVRCIEAHAVKHGWLIHRANPKLTGESDWLDGHASIADTPAGMWAQSQYLLELMTHRQGLVKAAGVDDWSQVPGIGPRVLYIIDEGANLMSPAIRDLRKIYATFTSSNVTTQGAMARSAGIHLVYVTQQPAVDSYGYAGGQLRLNIGARMIVGSSDAIWLRELFLGDLSPDIVTALASGIKGRAVFQGLDPDHGPRVHKAQIYYATQDQVRALLPAEPLVVPIDFNQLGPARWEAFMTEMIDTENVGRQRRPPKARSTAGPGPESENHS